MHTDFSARPEPGRQLAGIRQATAARVVYIAGSGHTGSTLLAMLLDTHPEIASVGEIAVKPGIRRRGAELEQACSCGRLVAECPFWTAIFERVRGDGLEFGPAAWTNDYRSQNMIINRVLTRDAAHPLMRGFQHWAGRSLPFYRARMRRIDRVNVSFVRAVLAVSGATVFVDASKQSMRLARLLRLPELDLRVLTLVRDVRGYAASAKRRGHSINDAAQSWKKDQAVIAEITRRQPPDRVMVLRYEDLCRELETSAARLWRFCGVEPMPAASALSSTDHHVLGNSMRMSGTIRIRHDETWRRTLDSTEEKAILRIAGTTNRAFGYV